MSYSIERNKFRIELDEYDNINLYCKVPIIGDLESTEEKKVFGFHQSHLDELTLIFNLLSCDIERDNHYDYGI